MISYWKTNLVSLTFVVMLVTLNYGEVYSLFDTNAVESGPEDVFINRLIEEYGSDGKLSLIEVRELLRNLEKLSSSTTKSEDGSTQPITIESDDPVTRPTRRQVSLQVPDTEQTCSGGNWIANSTCWTNKCLTADDIFEIHAFPKNDSINGTGLHEISPALLYTAQHNYCASEEKHIRIKPDAAKVWGYGFLCVTLINLCSLGGLVFLPLMSKKFYKKLLMFMVALAVGTLCGSALLFLIPECFGMTAEDSPLLHTYIWRSTAIIGGIYLFFLIERLLKIIMMWRQRKEERYSNGHFYGASGGKRHEEAQQKAPMCSIHSEAPRREEGMNMSFDLPRSVEMETSILRDDSSAQLIGGNANNSQSNHNGTDARYTMPSENSSNSLKGAGDSNQKVAVVPAAPEEVKPIKTVAWMVIFGDGLHNFIDGLSIGAAFAQSITSGVSISIAVICEELPHELGDFAILLNAGMTMKQALCANFLSACMCYFGFVIGALIGDSSDHAIWIFAIAGGMFLYISLVDMLPEVNQAAEQDNNEMGEAWRIFFLQNAGLLSGFAIMLILVNYTEMIDFS